MNCKVKLITGEILDLEIDGVETSQCGQLMSFYVVSTGQYNTKSKKILYVIPIVNILYCTGDDKTIREESRTENPE